MSSSLDKLVSNLPKELFKYISEEFTGDKLSFMSQKDVYRYDYMDSFEKFDQTELPTKDLFYNALNDQQITRHTTLQAKFGKPSTLKQWLNTMTYALTLLIPGGGGVR